MSNLRAKLLSRYSEHFRNSITKSGDERIHYPSPQHKAKRAITGAVIAERGEMWLVGGT